MIVCNLIVDMYNLSFISYFSIKNQQYSSGLLKHRIIESIFYRAAEYNATGIVLAVDSPGNWRKKTLYKDYKANRVEQRDANFQDLVDCIDELCVFFDTMTNVEVVRVPEAEADDIIALIAQNSTEKNIILSNDEDFFQLVTDQTFIHNPKKGKGLVEYDRSNQKFDLFVKCIRGDRGDNIPSAYPRVYKTKLREAYDDPHKMVELLNTIPDGKTDTVGTALAQNQDLIDLTHQPQYIKDRIMDRLYETTKNPSANFDQISIMRWLKDADLVKILKKFNTYSSVLFRVGYKFR